LHAFDYRAAEALEAIREVGVVAADQPGDQPVAGAVQQALEAGIADHLRARAEAHAEGAVVAFKDLAEIGHDIARCVGPVGHCHHNGSAAKMCQPMAHRTTIAVRARVVHMAQMREGGFEFDQHCLGRIAAGVVDDQDFVIEFLPVERGGQRAHRVGDYRRLVVGRHYDRQHHGVSP